MILQIGDSAPDFTANTTDGKISFYQWMGDSYVILFSHPKDFTPVCTTELGAVAKLKPEFDKRNTKVIGLSSDTVESHQKWIVDINETQGTEVKFPIIADADLSIAKLYGMMHPNAWGHTSRTAAANETVRTVFIIGPDRKLRLFFAYPMSTGRNFAEILRSLDAIQLTDKEAVVTPVNWKPGDDVIIPPTISDEAARAKYPMGFKTVRPYLRILNWSKR
jgi:alkyl hydroperoxide reductase subunit AhpC